MMQIEDSSFARRKQLATPDAPIWFLAWGLVVGFLHGACAPEPPQPGAGRGRIRRLEMAPVDQDLGPRSGSATVAVFDVLEERDQWNVTYDKSRAHDKLAVDRSAPVLWIEGTRPRLVRKLEGIGEFSQVALTAIGGAANKDVALRFRRDGKTVLVTERKRFGRRNAQTILFDLQLEDEQPDEIELVFSSARGLGIAVTIGIESIVLLKKPLLDWLPDARTGADLVRIGSEGRRAVGLSKAQPLRVEFTPLAGEQLRFSFGVPEFVRRRGRGASFRIRLRAGDRVLERAFQITDWRKPAWHEATVDLEAFVGQPTELLASLETEDNSVIALGEFALSAPDKNPPSVLLLTSDTHRADHIGAAPNGVGIETPFLDELATAGMHFVDCWSPTNITLPAHVSLFTGTSPRDTGIVNNISALAPDAMTLAEHFHTAGYETLAVVSVNHLSFNTSGPGQGFDRMNVLKDTLDSSETLALAKAWLENSSTRPVFLWIHLFDAHSPYLPPSEFRRLYYPEDRDPFSEKLEQPEHRTTPPWLRAVRDLEYPQALYKSEITYLDGQLRSFYTGSRFEEGVVVMTADHGESFGAHGIWFEHRGLFPNTLSVPLIIKGPGIPAQITSTSPVTLLDVGRTLLDVCGLDNLGHPGRNLLELHETPSPEPRFALASHAADASVTVGPWHLVLHLTRPLPAFYEGQYERHQVQLYQLEDDSACLDDLAREDPERARRMRRILIEWLMAAQPVGWNVVEAESLDAREVEALASLGYATDARNTRSNDWFDAACECEFCEIYR